MPITPGITSTSLLDPEGLANQLADLRRRLDNLGTGRTVLQPGSVNGGNFIIPGSITTELLSADAVVAGNIAADAIQTYHLASKIVTAEKINVSDLSALSSNMGAITAGTIQGATIQTAGSGARTVMDTQGLRGYGLDGVTKVFEINSGSGIASFTGVAQITGGSIVPSAIPTVGGGNLLSDSSFEDASAGDNVVSANWSLYNDQLSPAAVMDRITPSGGGKHGAYILRLTNGSDTTGTMGVVNSGAAAPRVEPGKTYTLSAYGMPSGSGGIFQVHIHWYDAAWNLLSGGVTSPGYVGVGNVWKRAQVTGTAPPGAHWAACYAWVSGESPATTAALDTGTLDSMQLNSTGGGSGGMPSGFVFYFDALQLEEGALVTAYQPKITELLPGSIQTVHLAAGAVTANIIDAGAITAQHLSLKFYSANELPNARFDYFTGNTSDPGVAQADSPGYWQHYDNGSTGTKIWSKVAAGGPQGENAWRLQGNNASAFMGFMTLALTPVKTGTYAVSMMWKGAGVYPYPASNAVLSNVEWIDCPAPANVWQRYSFLMTFSSDGPRDINGNVVAGGGYDWFYIYPSATPNGGMMTGAFDCQIATIQRERGDYPTGFMPKSDELLPYSVGNTVLAPDSVTTEKILTRTILADDIVTGTLTADELTVSTLGAISANLGTILAGTITGATFRTSSNHPRVAMDASNGFTVTDSAGTTVAQIKGGSGQIDMQWHAASTFGPVTRRMRWLNGTSEVGTLYVWDITNVSDTEAGWILNMNQFSGGNPAALFLNQSTATGTDNAVIANAHNGVSGHSATILNGVGGSSFQFSASDASLKEDIEALANDPDWSGIETIKKLKPVRFNWRRGASSPNRAAYGLIAQEVEDVLPEAVVEVREVFGGRETSDLAQRERVVKNIDLRVLMSTTVSALQELTARVEALEQAGGNPPTPPTPDPVP
jgi:hypothetical protein